MDGGESVGLGKKGFFLTLLAVILSTLFIMLFSSRINNLPDYKTDVVESRVAVLNYYSQNFFSYAERTTVVSGYAALRGVLQDISTTRKYKENFTKEYGLCIFNGNLTPSKVCPNMEGKTLIFFLSNLSSSAEKELKISSSYFINNITITQNTKSEDPFYLEVNVNITLNISDRFANLSTTRVYTSFIPLAGILDPVYLLNGTYNQTIKVSNITKNERTWTPKDLEQLHNNREYRWTRYGVNFIDRMRGNFSNISNYRNDSMGIESIVNYTFAAALMHQNISVVDVLFWNNISYPCNQTINVSPAAVPSMPTGLQLDDEHKVLFNISSVYTRDTC
jgi:hypothetical protein